MTTIPPIVEEAEVLVRRLAGELTAPHAGECLCCYVARMLEHYPCDGTHRHAFRYRDAMAPRATALAERLANVGACCCDCELLLNGYQLRNRPPDDNCGGYDDYCDYCEGNDDNPAGRAFGDPGVVDALPLCEGVRRGSVRPCGNWVRIRRW